MIELIKVVMKNIRQKSAGSLNTKIPTRTVPTAPIPVQTAYAVPIGIGLWPMEIALYIKYMLMKSESTKPLHQK